ncbi:PQQ-like beta-propeller repeat protein [Rubripirellula amarantea]|nr:PQQ-like beta-propeller repeat protein [Rubripirellula amarantea]
MSVRLIHNSIVTATFLGAVAVSLSLASMHTQVRAETWPSWRGENGDNHASSETDAPIRWNIDTGENVLWQTKIPGRGHSSPIVVAESIFLTTADANEKTQSLVKINRKSGRLMNSWVLHRGTLPAQIHSNNSYASPTPAFDGEDLFVVFHTDDAIMLSKVTIEGRVVWQKRVSRFEPSRFQFGYGASPLIHDDLVIVAAEYDGPDSGLYALDRNSGVERWKVPRPSNLNFASPIAATIAGTRQVLLAGAEMITSYDPVTGRKLWSVDESTEAICGTAVWDGRRVMISGGNPASGTWCVSGDGTEKQLWNNGVKCYEQSLLTIDNFVFAVADSGVAYCWRTSDGKEMWKKRLFGGGISSSPLLVQDRFYVASEAGEMFIIKAIPDRFELLATHQVGDSMFASPVAVDNQLYLRFAKGSGGQRQEYLAAIGVLTANGSAD